MKACHFVFVQFFEFACIYRVFVYSICIQIASLLSGIKPTPRRISSCLTDCRLPPVWMVLILWLSHFMDSTDEGNLDHQGLTVAKYFEGRRREMTGRQFRVFQRASENLLETVAFSGALVVWQLRGRLTARVLATPIFFLHAAWSLGKKRNNWTLECFQACQHHSCRMPDSKKECAWFASLDLALSTRRVQCASDASRLNFCRYTVECLTRFCIGHAHMVL